MDIIRRLLTKSKIIDKETITQNNTYNEKTSQLGFLRAPANWQELREKHYHKWFGDLEDILVWHELLPSIPHVDVHLFPPSKELDRNYFTLITSGMSDEKMTLPKGIDHQYARAEIVFYIGSDETKTYQTEKPWYVEALFFFAHFPFKYKTWFAFFYTIPNGDPPAPVVDGSCLTTAFFLPAIFEPKEFTQDFNLGNEKVNFMWLTYLTDKETEFKLKYGYDKLVEKF